MRPGELQGPVGHDERWLWLAGASLALVALYYVVVLRWGRRRGPEPGLPPREACLRRLDDVVAEVADGTLSVRQGHQQVSHAVRTFVGDLGGRPASRMTLTDLERGGHDRVADVVARVYPPAFAPGAATAADLDRVVERARELVLTWEVADR